jgi:hypothetical protein
VQRVSKATFAIRYDAYIKVLLTKTGKPIQINNVSCKDGSPNLMSRLVTALVLLGVNHQVISTNRILILNHDNN